VELTTTKTELSESLVGELNQLHLKACQLDETIKKQFAEKLQVYRQIANLIESARNSLHGAKFEAFIRRLNFSQPTLRSYEIINKRARKSPGVLHWRDIMDFERSRKAAATAALSAKPAQRLHNPSNYLGDISRYLQRVLVYWAKAQNARPLSRWETLQLETFSMELRPLVDVYSKIKQELAKRE
jgi:hypothetical protein